jgi:hypothetical protein
MHNRFHDDEYADERDRLHELTRTLARRFGDRLVPHDAIAARCLKKPEHDDNPAANLDTVVKGPPVEMIADMEGWL